VKKQKAKDVAKAKKEMFTEKARVKRKQEKEQRKVVGEAQTKTQTQTQTQSSSSFYAKPAKSATKPKVPATGKTTSERVVFDEKAPKDSIMPKPAKATNDNIKPQTPPSGASLYTRKLPKKG